MTEINAIISKPNLNLKNDKVHKVGKSDQKIGIKLYDELHSQGTHYLNTSIKSEAEKWQKFTKWEKVTKINQPQD